MHEILEYNNIKMKKRKSEIESGRINFEQDKANPAVIFITKPGGGCQGRGIQIMRSFESLKEKMEANSKKQEKEIEEFLRLEKQQETAQIYSHQPSLSNTAGFSHQNSGVSAASTDATTNVNSYDRSNHSIVV